MTSPKWASSSMPYVVQTEGGEGQAWEQEAAAGGRRGTHRIVEAGLVVPPHEVANLLGIAAADGSAVARRRVVYLDGRAVEQADSYYPAAIAAGTPLADLPKVPGGAVKFLAQLGYVGASVTEDVTARRPNEAEQILFEIDTGEPILVVTRQIRAANDKPIQVDVLTTPGIFRRYRYEIRIQ